MSLPLTRPLATIHGHPSLERHVALIRLTLKHPLTQREAIGVGELAPLPGKDGASLAVRVCLLCYLWKGCLSDVSVFAIKLASVCVPISLV